MTVHASLAKQLDIIKLPDLLASAEKAQGSSFSVGRVKFCEVGTSVDDAVWIPVVLGTAVEQFSHSPCFPCQTFREDSQGLL